MINQSTVTIVNEETPTFAPGNYTYSTFESRSVQVRPNSFGPGYMVAPQTYRPDYALYVLKTGCSSFLSGILLIIAGALIIHYVSSFNAMRGVILLAFGCPLFCVGVCLLSALCCIAKRTSPERAQISTSTTGDINTASGQTTSPSGQGINGQFSQPGAFGQNPPTYTGLNHQYPPAYQPTSAQYAQQNQGFSGDQNPPQYQGSNATPYQTYAHQFDKPYQQ